MLKKCRLYRSSRPLSYICKDVQWHAMTSNDVRWVCIWYTYGMCSLIACLRVERKRGNVNVQVAAVVADEARKLLQKRRRRRRRRAYRGHLSVFLVH